MSFKKTIQICKQNIQSLKSQIGLCEAQITFGSKKIKNKYNKEQQSLQQKLQEETFWYKKYIVSQWLLNDCGVDLSNNILDEKVNNMYKSLSPQDIQECSMY
jgi:hypothetical protein